MNEYKKKLRKKWGLKHNYNTNYNKCNSMCKNGQVNGEKRKEKKWPLNLHFFIFKYIYVLSIYYTYVLTHLQKKERKK